MTKMINIKKFKLKVYLRMHSLTYILRNKVEMTNQLYTHLKNSTFNNSTQMSCSVGDKQFMICVEIASILQ